MRRVPRAGDGASGRQARAVLDELASKLGRLSDERAAPAFARLQFPDRLDAVRPVLPTRLVSLDGHLAYEELDVATRWRLGLLETVNFFSLNIHGEQALVAELANSLYQAGSLGETYAVSRYLQHFIHEENSHTYMLAEFCTRYYGGVMPDVAYRLDNPALSRVGEQLLFLSRAYVLETFLDGVNRVSLHDETLDPTARAIHAAHHHDESRHIAFDTAAIFALICRMTDQGLHGEIATVARMARSYGEYAFSRLLNPWVYRELGLDDPMGLVRDIRASPRWLARKHRCLESQERFFLAVGLVEPPS
jgi:hypothetical protein